MATTRSIASVLVLLFVGSGCAALIYEVIWLQLLQLLIGSSAVSLAVLLGTYMGGMCLGSWFLPRWVSARHHPLRVYAAIELGIGLFGLMVLFGVPRMDQMYAAIGLSGGLVEAIVPTGVRKMKEERSADALSIITSHFYFLG